MTLSVKPISAVLFRDTEIFSKMDPYVTAIVGADKQRSRTHQEGGKRPKWNDEFFFKPKGSAMLVTVYDQDIVSDDIVGSTNVLLKKYIDNPGVSYDQSFSLSYEGKQSGKINLVMKYSLPQNGGIWPNNTGGNQNVWVPPQNNQRPPPPNPSWGQQNYTQPSYPQSGGSSYPQLNSYNGNTAPSNNGWNNQNQYNQYANNQNAQNNAWNNAMNQKVAYNLLSQNNNTAPQNNQLNQQAIGLFNQSQKGLGGTNPTKTNVNDMNMNIWGQILQANVGQVNNGWGSNNNIPSNNGWGSNNNIGNNGWGTNPNNGWSKGW